MSRQKRAAWQSGVYGDIHVERCCSNNEQAFAAEIHFPGDPGYDRDDAEHYGVSAFVYVLGEGQ